MKSVKVKSRKEEDSLGTVFVPGNAYYGANTQRAVENFGISGLTFPSSFIHSLALIKKCAANFNCSLGLIDKKGYIRVSQSTVSP